MTLTNTNTQILTYDLLKSLKGKTIRWSCPAAKGNKPYGGVAIVWDIRFGSKYLIAARHISGDYLSYAFIESGHICYSDFGRFITFELI